MYLTTSNPSLQLSTIFISGSPRQKSPYFNRLQNNAFWIWNIEEHKLEDIKTNWGCCFNHIIGLPQKDSVDKPLYDYEKIIFDSLIASSSDIESGNINPNKKHLWIKKATGLGISEFMAQHQKRLALDSTNNDKNSDDNGQLTTIEG